MRMMQFAPIAALCFEQDFTGAAHSLRSMSTGVAHETQGIEGVRRKIDPIKIDTLRQLVHQTAGFMCRF